MRPWGRPGKRLPPCAVVAALLLMRAAQKSCSRKGGRGKSCVSSWPPAVLTGRQKELRTPHWAPQPTAQNAFWCLPTARLGLQLQPQVLGARIPVAAQVCARLAVLPPRHGLCLRACGPQRGRSCVPPRREDNGCAGFYGAQYNVSGWIHGGGWFLRLWKIATCLLLFLV